MKVVFSNFTPFMLAHGGGQVQIEQTMVALQRLGVEAEPLRWWDADQTADVLHHFTRPPVDLIHLAHQKGLRVVVSAIESGLARRSPWTRFLLRTVRRTVKKTGPARLRSRFRWDCYQLSDACIALTPWEARLLVEMFQTDPAKVHTIPNGVENVFLQAKPATRGPWLVCTATIIELKQVLKLAQMAVLARTPVWIIGRPFSDSDEYVQQFTQFARRNPDFVRYEGAIADRERLAGIYREARGFVLLSRWEGLSLSALEAAACGCPLLLSDLPWARLYFQDKATYCPANKPAEATAPVLRTFYDQAPALPVPDRPLTWLEVGKQIQRVYETLVSNPR